MDDDQSFEVRDTRKQNYFTVDNVIIDHYASLIGALPTLVYCSLCRHANRCTRETFPSFNYLAKELKLGRRTVIRSIGILLEHQLIARKHRKSKTGEADSNVYIILEPWGSATQAPHKNPAMLHQSNDDEEVVPQGHHVVPERHQGVVPERHYVVPQGHPNNTQLTKKTNTPPTPSVRGTRSTKLSDHPKHAPDAFEQFYRAYPKRKNPQDAMKAWDTLQPNDSLQALIFANVAARARDDPQWVKDQGEFVPYPGTYLRQARWKDEWQPRRHGVDKFVE